MNGNQRHEIVFWPKIKDQNERILVRTDSDRIFNVPTGSEEYLNDKEPPRIALNSKFEKAVELLLRR